MDDKRQPAARLPVSANESYEVKNDGFKPSLRQSAIYRGWAPPATSRSLKRRLGFEPKRG